ncbi:YggS family pyridoxal phosphate-dependent enzyme [Vagococcus silagei]|uniref:Pyridoxal phosphate homeostasis protein n=1 Tax=Vagococcus silagei TaxID=2508885 RepID=A0A4S3B5U3_9ENTE|nr:YggS family pyridoxal phosphate-dependent enzyme [Vagococcus silagei]THB60846.1 YggS family pyridoxal phosphate-dependent enzyme [Vagococcus silagei]
MINTNVETIRQNIKVSCQKRQRDIEKVNLICVSKSVGVPDMETVFETGIRQFAENRVDALAEKQAHFKDSDIIWHFIGRLQRRKVKDVINTIDYFHALDSLKLAHEIQKRADTKIKCFVQVNISGETSKQGVSPEDLMKFVTELIEFDKIEVVGLMTMAPFEASEGELRLYFSELKRLQTILANKNYNHAPCQELSMGMSQDYQIAIEEGATFVRVGSAFFKK